VAVSKSQGAPQNRKPRQYREDQSSTKFESSN